MKLILVKDYQREYREVKSVFRTNLEHPAIIAATEHLTRLLEQLQKEPGETPQRIETAPMRKHARRLLYGADPQRILIKLCAVRLYLLSNGLPVRGESWVEERDLMRVQEGQSAFRACPLGKLRSPTANTAKCFAERI